MKKEDFNEMQKKTMNDALIMVLGTSGKGGGKLGPIIAVGVAVKKYLSRENKPSGTPKQLGAGKDVQKKLVPDSSVTKSKVAGSRKTLEGTNLPEVFTPEELEDSWLEIKNFPEEKVNRLLTPKSGYIRRSRRLIEELASNYKNNYDIDTTPVKNESNEWVLQVDYVPKRELADVESDWDDMILGMERGDFDDIILAMKRGDKVKGKGIPSVSLGHIDSERASIIYDKTGLDVHLCEMVLDIEGVLHALEDHGLNEKTPGQIPLTKQDLHRIPETIMNPQVIIPGGNKQTIQFVRGYPGGVIYVQEYKFIGKNKLRTSSLWKKVETGPMVLVIPASSLLENDDEEN